MGARSFYFETTTHDLNEAFKEICENEREEYGHRNGYSFNKSCLKQIRLPEKVKTEKQIRKFIEELFEKDDQRYFDKYSSHANYIRLPQKSKVSVRELSKVDFEVEKNIKKQKKVWKTIYLLLNSSGEKLGESTSRQDSIKMAKSLSQKMNCGVINIEESKKLISGSPKVGKTKLIFKDVKKDAYTYIIFGMQPE